MLSRSYLDSNIHTYLHNTYFHQLLLNFLGVSGPRDPECSASSLHRLAGQRHTWWRHIASGVLATRRECTVRTGWTHACALQVNMILIHKNHLQTKGIHRYVYHITSGSRGGRTRRAPPLTAADLWFFYAQNAIFLKFSSLASLANHFKPYFNRNVARKGTKTR